MLSGRTWGNARSAGVIAAAASAFTVLATALSAWAIPSPAERVAARRLAAEMGADLSETRLQAMRGRMTPGAAAMALRHDPAGGAKPFALSPEGWANLSLDGRPDLGFNPLDPNEAQRINAAIPGLGALDPARPFVLPADSAARARALRCLTQAIYYEAALEPRDGKEGVAQVVLNRVRDPNYPSSVCGVVFQGAELSTGCQFSFTCDGSLARGPVAWAWKESQEVAERALNGYVATQVGTATHYHADYVLPYWGPSLDKLNQIGAHIFYRWRGRAGEPGAFVQRWAGREPAIDEARFSRPRATPAAALLKANAVVVPTEDGGATRVVATLGGRRKPTRDEIARINEALARFETGSAAGTPAAPAAPTPVASAETAPTS